MVPYVDASPRMSYGPYRNRGLHDASGVAFGKQGFRSSHSPCVKLLAIDPEQFEAFMNDWGSTFKTGQNWMVELMPEASDYGKD